MPSIGGEDWTGPDPETVAPGVHRIALPLPNDGLRAVNVYAVETADGLVLVDAGWALDESLDRLVDALTTLGAGLADIVRFLVTHVHRDHYTQAVAIRRAFGTRVELGIGERPTLEYLHAPGARPFGGLLPRLAELGAGDLADQIAAAVGEGPVDRSEWEPPDAWLEPGEVALAGGPTLTAVATPGHTAGHLVFHDESGGLMYAGDHVLSTITPSIGFEPLPSDAPLAAFLASLAAVRRRPDARLLPAHGPTGPSVHARVDELIGHHERRLAEMSLLLDTTPASAAAVAAAVPWTRRRRRLDELDPFNRMLAVFETAAHLDLLVAQGRSVREASDGIRRYAAPRPAR